MSEINHEITPKKKGLGRGLGSLLGSSATMDSNMSKSDPEKASQAAQDRQKGDGMANQLDSQTSPENKIWHVAIDKLSSGAFQPRKLFNKEAIEELAQSIRENGILQPIVARRTGEGKLEIVAGERRWRAAQLAGLHEVPVILKSLEDKEALELAIIENIQREDLNPIEEAEGFQKLIQEFSLSQSQVAERVGKDRATIANAIRLLNLSLEVRDLVATQGISVGHAKVLLAITDEKQQIQLAKQIVSEKMTVRKLEKLTAEILGSHSKVQDPAASPGVVSSKLASSLAEDLQKSLGTRVSIDYSAGKGKLSIYFYSDDELNSLADRIRKD